MSKITNVTPKKGFRNAPKPTKAMKIEELQKMLANLQMAVRVMQMGMQQIGNSVQAMEKDINSTMGVLNDIQYRTLAMLEMQQLDKDKLEAIAADMKLKDYNESSDREDAEKGYEIIDTIEKDSVVIITSECPENLDNSIFRSKFKLDESSNKKAIEEFPGKKVGDKFEFEIGGKKHIIEVLGVRKVPTPEKTDLMTEALPEELESKENACSNCDKDGECNGCSCNK